MRATRDQVLLANPLDRHIRDLGIVLHGSGNSLTCSQCPAMNHRKDHLCVSVNVEKQVFNCHDCKVAGSIIDWIAIQESESPESVLKRLAEKIAPTQPIGTQPRPAERIVRVYDYTDENRNLIFQVVRFEPKNFRQRRPDGRGGWLWNMDGVTRCLFHLDQVILSQTVLITEGEKDVETLTGMGFIATCNAGGSEKWLDAYSEFLVGKDVIIVPDSDDKGQKHAQVVKTALAEKANSIKVVAIPKPHKDVSDWRATLVDDAAAGKALTELINRTPHALAPLPIYTMEELQQRYRQWVNQISTRSFDLSRFIPSLAKDVRRLVPGELLVVVADTGVGKTAFMQGMARCTSPLPTLFFELELPEELMFERFCQIQNQITSQQVEDWHKSDSSVNGNSLAGLNHILVCPESGVSTEKMAKYIGRSELRFGMKPVVVFVDYIGLIGSEDQPRSRYEMMSRAAEQLKSIAKQTQTIIIVGTQIARKDRNKAEQIEVSLHECKDSGSIENSAGLVLGMWRPGPDTLKVKILKNTKGLSGREIECNFHGPTMRITERSPVSDEDVPNAPYSDA